MDTNQTTRKRHINEVEYLDNQNTIKRKVARLSTQSSPQEDVQVQKTLTGREEEVFYLPSSKDSKVSGPARFLDSRFYTPSASDDSIGSYRQYLDIVARGIESTYNTYETHKSASYREWHKSWKQWQHPIDIPDAERMVELDDDASIGDRSDVVKSASVEDPRKPTLAKLLNAENEVEYSVKGEIPAGVASRQV